MPKANIAINKLIIQFKRKVNKTLIIFNKLIKTGFKLWIIIDLDYMLYWFYYIKIKGAWSCLKITGLNPIILIIIYLLKALLKGLKGESYYYIWCDGLVSSLQSHELE